MTQVPIISTKLDNVEYRYLISDFRNNEIIGDLPLKNVSYENKLSAVGEFSGDIQVNEDTKLFKIRENVRPGRTCLYVLRNGHPIWGGIIWKTRYSGRARNLEVSASTFESYLYRRFQLNTLSFKNTEQFQIAASMIGTAMSDIGVQVYIPTASGVQRQREFYRYEFKEVGEELEQLANLINGFDWNVILYPAAGNKVERRLQFFYPDRGVSKANTKLAFEYPGSIKDFSFTQDAEAGATVMWAIGAGEDAEQLDARASDVTGGWPELHTSMAYKTVKNKATLQQHANSDLRRLRSPVEIADIYVRGNVEPYINQYNPGDWARLSFSDSYYTPPFATFMRIIGYTVTVDDDGIETIRLTVNTERDEL